MPLISVIVPVYKTEQYLRQCVDSIINQTFKDFELILVDDGSPDNCPAICDEYANNFENVKVIHKANGGLVSARKAGTNVASGQYVLAVDSDDFITDDYLQGFADAIEKNNADIVVGGFCTYNETNTTPFCCATSKGYYDKSKLESDVYNHMLSTDPFYTFGIHPSLCTKCIRRELLINNQTDVPNNITMGEDAVVTYACLLDANSLEIIENNGYMYRYNDSSMTHSYDPKMASRCISLIEYMYSMMEKKGWDAESQLYAYTIMIQDLIVQNEMRNEKVEYTNLKLWTTTPRVKEILSKNYKLRLRFVKRIEAFAVHKKMFWILSFISLARRIKHR